MITQTQAEQNFRALIEEADRLIATSTTKNQVVWEGFFRWQAACRQSIELTFGANYPNLQDFQKISYSPPTLPNQTPNSSLDLVYFITGLKVAKELLESMLFTIIAWWPSEQVTTQQAIVFITHGGKRSERPLNKIDQFLIAIGASPIIIEKLPNVGKGVDEKVNLYMQICNCAIAMLTAEDITNKGELRVRENIHHEIGMLQTLPQINGKIIYLKENTVKLPTNYNSKGWHEFALDHLDNAFIDIAKELNAFGY